MSANDTPPAAAILQRETRSSIELTRNAKGEYQWTIKLYSETGFELLSALQIQAIDQRLRQMFIPQTEQKETEA